MCCRRLQLAAEMDNPSAISFLASLKKSGLSQFVAHDQDQVFLSITSCVGAVLIFDCDSVVFELHPPQTFEIIQTSIGHSRVSLMLCTGLYSCAGVS